MKNGTKLAYSGQAIVENKLCFWPLHAIYLSAIDTERNKGIQIYERRSWSKNNL